MINILHYDQLQMTTKTKIKAFALSKTTINEINNIRF
jgi:hypothetical protein